MENLLQTLNTIVVHVCQFLAMFVISIGIVKAMLIFLKDALTPHKSKEAIQESRLELGHSFSLGLGFLIGASILKTTIAPTWTDIGQLAAVIAIRTVLNYFLLRDIANHQDEELEPPARKGLAGLFRRKRKPQPEPQAEETASETKPAD